MNREPFELVQSPSILDMSDLQLLRVAERVVLALDTRSASACLAVVVERMRPRVIEVEDASYAMALQVIGSVVGTYKRPVTSHQVLEDLKVVQAELRPQKK